MHFLARGQGDSTYCLSFDFNEHEIKEAKNILPVKPVGVRLTEDRFGNKESAVYMNGSYKSYLNLGPSDFLKPVNGTISMWVNIQMTVLAGKGYVGNPFITMRTRPFDDFNIGFGLGYNYLVKRLGAQASKDSLLEVMTFAKDTITLNKWYHVLVTYDDDYFAFYIDGVLQQKAIKGFKSVFLKGDSVLLGRSTGEKNQRFTHGAFDDIRFYNYVLSEKEIQELYHEPNPNRVKKILFETFKYLIIIIILIVVIILLLIRNKRNLKKQKEFYELNHRIKELEIKVIKSQMNPHFISNSLAAIQNLIYKKEIERAGQYLAKFSFFLRQVLDYSDKTYITLKEELDIAKLNIELEQLRFGDNFTFELKIDKGIDTSLVVIPSLVTQPFIENAIWHGLLPLKKRNPKLQLHIFLNKQLVYVSIEDNGIGRKESAIVSGKNSKGTKLVLDKIESINRLRESTDYKLEIEDLYDELGAPAGTRIIIQLSTYISEE